MDKKMKSSKNPLVRFRGWIQAAATLLTNIHIPNLFKGKIYQGNVKTMCVPGLNCYSCPAATGACPIGAFQAVVGSSKFKFTYYITGFFILLGVLLGRFICGFLCPFGWFQDLLHKIPGKKFSTAKLKPLRYLKYVILVVFVILLPAFVTNSLGMGDPFFCKYICPQGVLEGAIPLALANSGIRSALGHLFTFKFTILALFIIALILLKSIKDTSLILAVFSADCGAQCAIPGSYSHYSAALWQLQRMHRNFYSLVPVWKQILRIFHRLGAAAVELAQHAVSGQQLQRQRVHLLKAAGGLVP